jgi:hypothetical protein
MILGVPTKIRTRHITNISQKPYRLIQITQLSIVNKFGRTTNVPTVQLRQSKLTTACECPDYRTVPINGFQIQNSNLLVEALIEKIYRYISYCDMTPEIRNSKIREVHC